MSDAIRLNSDFSDFYDYKFSANGEYVYNRIKNKESKLESLKYLRNIGVRTIQIKPVSKFVRGIDSEKVVVYTDINSHGPNDKIICSGQEALIEFPNYLGSNYIEFTCGKSIKVVHIGKRIFQVIMQNDNPDSLEHGKVISISEVQSGISFNIREPIYSIDYIPIGNIPIATDLNSVQQLDKLGLQSLISADEVYEEVNRAMLLYGIIRKG